MASDVRTSVVAASERPACRRSGATLAHRSHAQAGIAEADAALRAARLLLLTAAADLDRAAAAGEPITVAQRGALRAGMCHAARVAREVVTAMYVLGSSSSLYTGNRLERVFRDTMAAAQHGLLSPTFLELSGRIRLGLDSGMPIF